MVYYCSGNLRGGFMLNIHRTIPLMSLLQSSRFLNTQRYLFVPSLPVTSFGSIRCPRDNIVRASVKNSAAFNITSSWRRQNSGRCWSRRKNGSGCSDHLDLLCPSYSILSWRLCSTASVGIYAPHSDFEGDAPGAPESKKFVVVVESPAKAKTIEKYLGADFTVLPSYGHVRDLAARAGSVRPDDDYAMVWEVPEAAQPHVTRIKNALTGAKSLVLASDPDREGEAIAWHISELMKAEGFFKNKKIKVLRVTFNEITKNSVLQAMQLPREISLTLVNAYLARRALDHLIGFGLSPVLWRKLPGSRSAGRVQSAALRLVCQKESEIEEFTPREYWTVETFACCEKSRGPSQLFQIRPTYYDGKKIEQFSLSSNAANQLREKLHDAKLKVSSVKSGSRRRYPPSPYMTSTLQQDAQSKLGFGAVRTMSLAQKLYEGVKLGNEEATGLITYMRTDGLELSKEAVQTIRSLATERYGDRYVPTEPKKFTSKVKNAQEAHEAIRPTDIRRLPSQLAHVLENDSLSLYTMIWRRTMACQMEAAVYDEVSVDFITEDEAVCAHATSSCVSFPGYFAAMQDKQCTLDASHQETVGYDDVIVGESDDLSLLENGDIILVRKVEAQQHFTRPPARYSEGLLVKAMEELGIGRPSTYASTLRTLQLRKYVKIENHRIIPEFRGRMVIAFLSHYFPKFIDYSFTADLEEQLDEVSGGRLEWRGVLQSFWPEFHEDVTTVMKIPIQKVVEMMQETFATQWFKGLGTNGCLCPNCGIGKLTLKLSRYGSGYFFGCDSYPDCSFKAEVLSAEDIDSSEDHRDTQMIFKQIEHVDIFIGLDPTTNLEVRAKKGPFGYYIQLGEDGKRKQFFKIPVGMDPSDVTLDKAIQLMKYPLTLGKHPDDGDAVVLGVGKKSYFIRHRSATVLVPKDENVESMSLERAVELLKGKDVKRRGRKSLLVLAAEEKERNIAQLKRTAKYLKQPKLSKDKSSDMAIDKKSTKLKAGLISEKLNNSKSTNMSKRATRQKHMEPESNTEQPPQKAKGPNKAASRKTRKLKDSADDVASIPDESKLSHEVKEISDINSSLGIEMSAGPNKAASRKTRKLKDSADDVASIPDESKLSQEVKEISDINSSLGIEMSTSMDAVEGCKDCKVVEGKSRVRKSGHERLPMTDAEGSSEMEIAVTDTSREFRGKKNKNALKSESNMMTVVEGCLETETLSTNAPKVSRGKRKKNAVESESKMMTEAASSSEMEMWMATTSGESKVGEERNARELKSKLMTDADGHSETEMSMVTTSRVSRGRRKKKSLGAESNLVADGHGSSETEMLTNTSRESRGRKNKNALGSESSLNLTDVSKKSLRGQKAGKLENSVEGSVLVVEKPEKTSGRRVSLSKVTTTRATEKLAK